MTLQRLMYRCVTGSSVHVPHTGVGFVSSKVPEEAAGLLEQPTATSLGWGPCCRGDTALLAQGAARVSWNSGKSHQWQPLREGREPLGPSVGTGHCSDLPTLGSKGWQEAGAVPHQLC